MNANSPVAKMIISSARRDRCIEHTEDACIRSSAKSRSDTASSELRVGAENPSRVASSFRSTGNVVPARAAEPRGERAAIPRADSSRSISRASISTYASAQCPMVTGWAR
ncbi:MAG: hypothetical protein KF705_03920 [Phycisphaeraceae bacterium]|nr:hypothetical protein [Phycisphaeraceae bacterium]